VNEQKLWLDPLRAHRAGVDLGHAGAAITRQRESLGAEIAAASADRPWGKDDIGSAFEQKYRGFETTVLKAWQSVGSYVTGLGANVVQSVNASVETDAASGDRIQQTAR
jgi:hypothetical protein